MLRCSRPANCHNPVQQDTHVKMQQASQLPQSGATGHTCLNAADQPTATIRCNRTHMLRCSRPANCHSPVQQDTHVQMQQASQLPQSSATGHTCSDAADQPTACFFRWTKRTKRLTSWRCHTWCNPQIGFDKWQ